MCDCCSMKTAPHIPERWTMAGTQLSGHDVAFLSLEGQSTPMHMGAVVTFRPRGKVDGGKLATLLAQRAAKIPKLRQLARTALFPPGAASWAEDPEFDATRHIHLHRASGLYEPDPLAEYASRWIAQPLDTSKPLWDLHVVTRLPDNRFALLLKLHHALTDGVGAFTIAAGLLDELPIAAARTPVTPAQTPSRSTLESVKDTLTSTWAQAGEAATIASYVLRAARPYPTSPITAPSTKDRSVGFVRLAVSDVRRIRTSHGGTTNDVVLAVLAGALRQWLINRGQRADGRSLRALIPVSVRARQAEQTGGNKLSGYLCELPIGIDDPLERLRIVRRAMTRNKAAGPARGAGAFPLLADKVPPAVHRLTRHAARHLPMRAAPVEARAGHSGRDLPQFHPHRTPSERYSGTRHRRATGRRRKIHRHPVQPRPLAGPSTRA